MIDAKYKVGVLGATGMVGQRFVSLLENHPWFEVVVVAASPQSAGKTYEQAVDGRWTLEISVPAAVRSLTVQAVEADAEAIAREVRLVFCALDLDKESIQRIEEHYASLGVAVVSNNSAHRWTADVPMLMPEINPEHTALIDIQRQKRGWSTGLIAVKPNCSIQSYVTVLTALKAFVPKEVHVTSMQAISGAGKTFTSWPEMIDTINPYIAGEEEKSEREPLKIWGAVGQDEITPASDVTIQATCVRVPVSDGHMASVAVRFENAPTHEEFIKAITEYDNPVRQYDLPSAPEQLIAYRSENDRPQTKLDRDYGHGMGISVGRLRDDQLFDLQFISLAHNTIRGAAGGAVLMAELLVAKGYIGR